MACEVTTVFRMSSQFYVLRFAFISCDAALVFLSFIADIVGAALVSR